RDEGGWVKILQVGGVRIGDDVEIGANTTIDRGALDDTVIEDGVKLDNLIQVGHNCVIGAHTVIAGCTGISGSVRIGSHCMRVVALKSVTANEPFFPGHFPHYAVMPGVLIVEAMAQAAAVLSLRSLGYKNDGKWVYYFVGIDGARFKRPVVPGDQLTIEVTQGMARRGIGKFNGIARVGDAVAAEAELLCTLRQL